MEIYTSADFSPASHTLYTLGDGPHGRNLECDLASLKRYWRSARKTKSTIPVKIATYNTGIHRLNEAPELQQLVLNFLATFFLFFQSSASQTTTVF